MYTLYTLYIKCCTHSQTVCTHVAHMHDHELHHMRRISELQAQHEAERQEDKLQIEEKQKRINELEKKLDLKAQEEQKLEQQRKVN